MDLDIKKQQVLDECSRVLEEKELALKALILSTRESNNDTKSSMGDKYETSREMLQQEINMLEKQLSEILNQQAVIRKIKDVKMELVGLGSLVKTSMGIFYISIGIGELKINKNKIMTISLSAPLAKLMLGKRGGDTFVLNGKNQIINQIL